MTASPDTYEASADERLLSLWMGSITSCLRAINEEQDLSTVLTLVAQQACRLLELQQCAVYVLDRSTGTFRIGGSHGLTEEYVDWANANPMKLSEATPKSGPPTARAALMGTVVTVRDAFKEPGLERWRPSMGREGLRTIVAAPLRGSDERAIGTITGYSSFVKDFTDTHLAQLALLSDNAAAAIVAANRRDSERAAISALSKSNEALRRQQQTTANLRDLLQELMQLVLQNSGLDHIASFLAERLNVHVYIDTDSGTPIAHAGRRGQNQAPDPFGSLTSLPEDRVRAVMESGRATKISSPVNETMFLVPVPSTGAQRICMWISHQASEPLDEDAVRAMEGCALLIALEHSRGEIRAQAEAGLARDLLADLLSPAAMVHRASVMARATALGHDPRRAHTPVVVAAVTTTPPPAHAATAPQLAAALNESYRDARPKPVIGTVGQSVVALIPADDTDGVPPARSVTKFLEQARRPGRSQFRWIVGKAAPSLTQVESELNITLRAANLVTTESRRVLHLADLGVPGLLLEAATSDRMVAFAETVLGPVLRTDRAKEGELVNTLNEWFRCEMSPRDAAVRLFVHPNTVSYRLRRVGELTGLKLTNPGDLMTLRLALDILQIRGIAKDRPNHS
jgi:sugar diacid utilization regulator